MGKIMAQLVVTESERRERPKARQPAHSSHLLQPLNVGCFSPLKRAYRREIEGLIRNHNNHITKLEFLPAVKAAYDRLSTSTNTCSAFAGAGLIPHKSTPPAAVVDALWQARAPSNVPELEAHSTRIHERVRKHKSSSPASMIEMLDQIQKEAEIVMLSAELMRDQINGFEKVDKAASARRQHKKSVYNIKKC